MCGVRCFPKMMAVIIPLPHALLELCHCPIKCCNFFSSPRTQVLLEGRLNEKNAVPVKQGPRVDSASTWLSQNSHPETPVTMHMSKRLHSDSRSQTTANCQHPDQSEQDVQCVYYPCGAQSIGIQLSPLLFRIVYDTRVDTQSNVGPGDTDADKIIVAAWF